MTYNSIEELPNNTNNLNNSEKTLWMKVFNAALKSGKSEDVSIKIAFGAVKKLQDKKQKSEITHEIQFFISKASISTNGKMSFTAVSSDTEKDVFDERMSLELFSGFIKDFRGDEFISLAHYPKSDDGFTELGRIEQIFIDGNKMKIKGYFHNNPLGIASFNAIRKERREGVSPDKRIRLSIGFYDRKHKHGDFVYEYNREKPCVKCVLGIKDKTYIHGIFDHVALTRSPANKRAEFIEVSTTN